MIEEVYVTQETGMLIPETITTWAYCKVIDKLDDRNKIGDIIRIELKDNSTFKRYFEYVCQCPTQAVLAKWLRVNHNIHINIRYEEYFYKINYKYFHFDISHGVLTDVTKNQDLHSDLMEECYQDIPGNYVNDEKFSKLIFERNFAFSTYEECFEYALQQALNLI